MKRILSISGGGMRGVMAARWMVELERWFGAPVRDCFDLVEGTSTGAILAGMAVSERRPSALEMLRFYYESGPKIFRKGWLDFGVFAPRYDNRGLIAELRACIGSESMGDVQGRVVMPTVDAVRNEAVFAKSWEPWWKNFPLWAAAAASSSAQTYFPEFELAYAGEKYRYLDGGNHSNNPAASALYEGWRLWPDEELLVVSIGTGKQVCPDPLPGRAGMLGWAPLVFGAMSECQDDVARYFCRNAPGVRFVELDVQLAQFPGMDDARSDSLDGLVQLTEAEIKAHGARLKEEILDGKV